MKTNASETNSKPPRRWSALRLGCLGFIGLIAFGSVIGTLVEQPQSQERATLGPDLETQQLRCDESWVQRIRGKAEAAGLVRGHQLDSTQLIVVVNPFRWNSLSLTSQQALALAEACRVDRGFALLTVSFRYDRDGDDLLRMGPRELYTLAQGQFVPAPGTVAPSGVGDLRWGARRPAGLKPVLEGGPLFIPESPSPFLGVAAREQDYDFEGGRLRGGHYYFDGPEAFSTLKGELRQTYGSPSWRDLNDLAHTYRWEWPKDRVSLEARYDLAKKTTTLTLDHPAAKEAAGQS